MDVGREGMSEIISCCCSFLFGWGFLAHTTERMEILPPEIGQSVGGWSRVVLGEKSQLNLKSQ